VAVSAAVQAQLGLLEESWPTTVPVRVRMGLHTGVCEERDNDYFGPTVNRAARLEAIAHGGQTVVSGTTADLTGGALAGGVRLRDLGQHRLRDLGRPEHVFQVEAEGLPASFPPLTSLDNPEFPNNLPGLLSVFIGRSAEIVAVRSLLAQSRLVTLTGAGGCGKTRLGLQAAAELLDTAPDRTGPAHRRSGNPGGAVGGARAAVPRRGRAAGRAAGTGRPAAARQLRAPDRRGRRAMRPDHQPVPPGPDHGHVAGTARHQRGTRVPGGIAVAARLR
jgi:hypothetical protein